MRLDLRGNFMGPLPGKVSVSSSYAPSRAAHISRSPPGGQICPSGMLARSADMARVSRGEGATGIQCGEVKHAIKHPTWHRTAENDQDQGAKAEKHWLHNVHTVSKKSTALPFRSARWCGDCYLFPIRFNIIQLR